MSSVAPYAEQILEFFDNPGETPYVIEHRHEEFTSVCPMTGHPDFGTITLRYEPAAVCVELKSLKLYLHAFRNEGMYFEAVTNKIRDDLATTMSPRWLQIISDWKGRGGVKSRVIAPYGKVPSAFAGG
ncbi:MAG: preQ(1) synthase [Planctomycetota bacterium]|nr:preQ(1) synthase [Planctomycetota bacterium]